MKEIINLSIHLADHERGKTGKHLVCKKLVWKLGNRQERVRLEPDFSGGTKIPKIPKYCKYATQLDSKYRTKIKFILAELLVH